LTSDTGTGLSGGDLTRQRILVAASRLFAERGYYGTSTTQIANEVGIRQPSLFFHFAGKQAIIATLLDIDLTTATMRLRQMLETGGSPAARLYAFFVCEISALLESPYDLRGPYSEAVLDEPGLAEYREARAAFHQMLRDLVAEGTAAGELREVDTWLAQQMLTATFMGAIWMAADRSGRSPDAREAAEFLLRGLLTDGVEAGRIVGEAEVFVGALTESASAPDLT